MKTLLYLASGPYKRHYDALPYELLVLVDKDIQTRITLRRQGQNGIERIGNLPKNGLVEIIKSYMHRPGEYPRGEVGIILELGMDALEGIELLRKLEIKIDALVSVNEGLSEGGGDYPLLPSGLVMGYVLPLFRKNLILVCDPSYYTSQFQGVFQRSTMWGYQKSELNALDDDYILPSQFSENGLHQGIGKVFMLSQNPECRRYRFNKLNVLLIKDSIWCDYDSLDVLAFPLDILSGNWGGAFNMRRAIEFLISREKVSPLDYSNLHDLLAVTERLKANKIIGLLAHSFFDNVERLRCLTSRSFTERASFQEVRFYCLTDREYEQSRRALDDFLAEEPLAF